MSKYVAIDDGKTRHGRKIVTVHLPAAGSGYATLCGINDDGEGLVEATDVFSKMVPVPPGRRVDCTICTMMWKVCQRYGAKDFG